MFPGRHVLLPFLGASFAAHLALLLYPAAPPVTPAVTRGDAGLQVTLARRVAGAQGAAVTAVPVTAARPQPERPSARPAPAPRPPTAAAVAPAPARPATTGAASDPAPASETRVAPGASLLASLREAMRPHFHYPLIARRRGWEGTVRVGLHISANGEISRLRIIETSRHAVLDQAAIDCLNRLRQTPGAVAWLDGHDSDIVLPVEYRLTDG
jgi:protein TonB